MSRYDSISKELKKNMNYFEKNKIETELRKNSKCLILIKTESPILPNFDFSHIR
jgi:hypothetical protein